MTNYQKPESENELISRGQELCGKNLSQLANEIGWSVPENLNHNKGWIGQLIEIHLGASAGNLSQPDFQNLDIELKTIPLNAHHKAKETTFVCVVPLLNHTGLQWQESCVYKKLKKVLWVPIEADPALTLGERKVGNSFLWSPTEEQLDSLQADWEEFMELISLGQVKTITAHQGEALQIRPKAANSSVLTTGIGQAGLREQTLPRGFYLRTNFTNQILKSYFRF